METQEHFAPYAPTENVLRVLNKARAGGLRGPIDVQYLIQLGIEQSMAPRSIRALRFLGFIDDDGKATHNLDDYVKADDDEARELLRQAILRSYGMVLRAVDPTSDPRVKVFNAFRMMKPQGQWDRMVTLFLGLCRAAGMDVKDAPPARAARLDGARERLVTRPRATVKRETAANLNAGAMAHLRGQLDRQPFDLDSTLVAFIEKLNAIESAEALDTWYKTFRALFEYVLANRQPPQPELPLQTDEAQAAS